MQQLSLFTASPINAERLKGQSRRLLDYLLAGNKIHVFHPAMKILRIGYLNSRCSDLYHKNNIPICRKRIMAADMDGNLVSVVEYSLDASFRL